MQYFCGLLLFVTLVSATTSQYGYGASYGTGYGAGYGTGYGASYGTGYGAGYGTGYGANYGTRYGGYGARYGGNYGAGYGYGQNKQNLDCAKAVAGEYYLSTVQNGTEAGNAILRISTNGDIVTTSTNGNNSGLVGTYTCTGPNSIFATSLSFDYSLQVLAVTEVLLYVINGYYLEGSGASYAYLETTNPFTAGYGYAPTTPPLAVIPFTSTGTRVSPVAYPSAGYGYGYPSTGYGYPSTGYGYPSTGYGYPSTGYGYPSTSYGYPSAGYGYPSGSYGYGYPSAGYGYKK